MFDLVITRLADSDLAEIVDYISGELSNPAAALDFLDEVESQYDYLRSNPRIFSVCTDSRLAEKEYRKVIVGNYLLLFRIDEETETVYVLRVVYHRQDYINLL